MVGERRERNSARAGGGLSFTFQRRLDAASTGLGYPMERAPNLSDWESWTPAEDVLPASGGYERVRVPVAADQAAEFFRVVVPDAP